MFWILHCLQRSLGQKDAVWHFIFCIVYVELWKRNDAVSCISYFALFKLNGEKKRMLYLVFHILYCARCVQLWERTDAVEQWMILRGYTSPSPSLKLCTIVITKYQIWLLYKIWLLYTRKNHNFWHQRCRHGICWLVVGDIFSWCRNFFRNNAKICVKMLK